MKVKTIDGLILETDDFKGYGSFKKFIQTHIDSKYGTSCENSSNEYEVELSAYKRVYTTVTVNARTQVEAERKAKEKVSNNWFEWYDYDEVKDIEVDSCEEMEND